MTVYKPHNWVLLEITSDDKKYYKILGGWSGGYLDGDSWRLNSGVARIEEDDDEYKFYGGSGSVYVCAKAGECVRTNIAGMLTQLLNTDRVKVISAKDINDEYFL